MHIGLKYILRNWISNLRIVYRHLKFYVLGFPILLFFFVQGKHPDYSTMIFLLLFFLEPFFINVIYGMLDTTQRYLIGGVELSYIVVINNLVVLTVSIVSFLALMLGMWIGGDYAWPRSLALFGTSIFSLITLRNYVSVFKWVFRLRDNEHSDLKKIIIRSLLHGGLIMLVSVPYLCAQRVFGAYLPYIFIIAVSTAIWWVTAIYHVPKLAHPRYMDFAEA